MSSHDRTRKSIRAYPYCTRAKLRAKRSAVRFPPDVNSQNQFSPMSESNNSPKFDRRPWGTFNVLDEGTNFKVKRIEVLPGKRLSYQKHAQRAEHWVVVQGTAKVTLDDRDIEIKTGQAIDIAVGSAHRVENPGKELLVFIEVQRGNYLGEDDIVRLQDDFGRAA